MNRKESANQCHFETHDHVSLFYRHWPATSQNTRGAIVLFHRGHEHGARMAHLVDELNLPDFDFFAWDARGHGLSPGLRGHSPSFAASVRDVQTFVEHIAVTHNIPITNQYIIAQSVGAVLISTWVHDYAPSIRGMTLASPAFKVKLYVPFARAGLALMYQLKGLFFVNSYVKAKFLTHDPERIKSYETDPLISRPIAVNILLDLYKAADRVVTDAQAITVPTQLLISGDDWVVHAKPQHQFFSNLGTQIKEKWILPGFYHDTLGEKNRSSAVKNLRSFLLRQFNSPATYPDLRQAHHYGVAAEKTRQLSVPYRQFSLNRWYWTLTRLGIQLGEKFSTGLKLGRETGFDSGSTLDYVYRNEPQGQNIIGKYIDRLYLNSIGWKGIRQRKRFVEELLLEAIQRLNDEGCEVRLMDIAAGHGRYVLDAVAASPVPIHSILLRDYSDINVRDGLTLINERGLSSSVKFEKADAFDRQQLTEVSPQPSLVSVSGLYELFSDNDLVSRSLQGVADALEPGGYLVYTNQPWHPQLEMIARALTSHREGQAWVMRCRSQAEMDQLVVAAGFRKITQRIDEWGIFSVSLAVKDL